ncbi:MAG: hypothetical protein CM15mP71_1460 [Candidatus Poseidoniales archaeon]|nr:MAG: hypothetical protein CM15mP71_1460 [Candidatus Poseidoniales archaeon]
MTINASFLNWNFYTQSVSLDLGLSVLVNYKKWRIFDEKLDVDTSLKKCYNSVKPDWIQIFMNYNNTPK